MRTFTIIWLGQLISTLGTYMTEFALILWAWQGTGSATALALVTFFTRLLRIPMTVFAGLLVDRFHRKHLMLIADGIAAGTTIAIAVLHFTDQLQIWHLYITAAISGGAGQLQGLAYQTSLTLIIPKENYIRANSLNSSLHYGSAIIAPAMAGSLLPQIGLSGILSIDLLTFGVALFSLAIVHLPQPQRLDYVNNPVGNLFLSFRQVWQQPSLRLLVLTSTLFWFVHDLGETIYDPMVLARSGGNAQTLASTATAAGLGGVAGAILLSYWGGSRKRIHSLLASWIGAGISKTLFGWGRNLNVWLPAQFCSSMNFPLLSSSESAIWMLKIAPEMQGRIFATNEIILQLASAIAAIIAGPLADQIFEPVIATGGDASSPIGLIFGTGAGAGMATLYVLCAIAMILIGIGGLFLPGLRSIEESHNIGQRIISQQKHD